MFGLKDIFSFDKLLTPLIIKLVYYVGFVLITIGGVVAAFGALFMPFGGGLGTALLTLIGTIFGLIGWRITIEVTIVFFGIFDRLGEIRNELRSRPGA